MQRVHHFDAGAKMQSMQGVVMNCLRRHAFLTEVLYDCSNFNFVHFLSLKLCSQIPTEVNSLEILFFVSKMLNKIKLSTDKCFISVYSF